MYFSITLKALKIKNLKLMIKQRKNVIYLKNYALFCKLPIIVNNLKYCQQFGCIFII